jgi:hypothetical protein
MLLPQFCWGQYNNSNLSGPQFNITGCGAGMNHYCPALLLYGRAIRNPNRGKRESELKTVLGEVEYTLRWMQDFPGCPIRGHVENTRARVRSDLNLPAIINRAQKPATSNVPVMQPDESNVKNEPVLKNESGAVVVDEQGHSQRNEETSQPQEDEKSKLIEPAKIGSPTNPHCRFCPPE